MSAPTAMVPSALDATPDNRASRWPVITVGILISIYPTWYMVKLLASALSSQPGLGSASLVVWGLYAIPFLLVIRHIDFFELEDWTTLALSLFWGGVVACGLSIIGNSAIIEILAVNSGSAFGDVWAPAIGGPTEELTKGIGILLILMASPRRPRTALDGFVVGATVGLGFQVVEDFIYTVNSGGSGGLHGLVSTFFVRGILGGLFSHAVYSGIVGLGLSYMITATHRRIGRRVGAAALGFVAAYLAHFLWNLPPIVPGEYGPMLGSLIKGIAIVWVLWRGLYLARRKDAAFFLPYLAGEVPQVVSPEEFEAMASPARRRAWAHDFRNPQGKPAIGSVRGLQRAMADLAVANAAQDASGVTNAVDRIGVLKEELTGIPAIPDQRIA